MVRTQIQLTENQAATLRALAAKRRVSMAEIIRLSIDNYLQSEAKEGRVRLVIRAKAAVGRFSSGSTEISVEHDRHLADAISND